MDDDASTEQYALTIRGVWRRTVGRSEKDPMAHYIFESIAVDLATNGLPETLEASVDRFEDVLANSQHVDLDDARAFCEALFKSLQDQRAAEDADDDESCLRPGECEMCERYMPLTKHHLIPRMMHSRLKKQGYEKELLNRTANICRGCHSAVHHFYTEKELAMEFNTIEKLMQCEEIARHAKWASKQPDYLVNKFNRSPLKNRKLIL